MCRCCTNLRVVIVVVFVVLFLLLVILLLALVYHLFLLLLLLLLYVFCLFVCLFVCSFYLFMLCSWFLYLSCQLFIIGRRQVGGVSVVTHAAAETFQQCSELSERCVIHLVAMWSICTSTNYNTAYTVIIIVTEGSSIEPLVQNRTNQSDMTTAHEGTADVFFR